MFVMGVSLKQVVAELNIYRAYTSFNDYKTTLSTSREGINRTPEELEQLDNVISPLVARGQSISHIYLTQRDKIDCTKQTLYNYIDKNYFSVCNLDLPRRVKYKKRKSKKKNQKTLLLDKVELMKIF